MIEFPKSSNYTVPSRETQIVKYRESIVKQLEEQLVEARDNSDYSFEFNDIVRETDHRWFIENLDDSEFKYTFIGVDYPTKMKIEYYELDAHTQGSREVSYKDTEADRVCKYEIFLDTY